MNLPQKLTLKSLKDTEKLAFEVANQFKGGETIALIGDLGSGKTTFVQFLAKALGIKQRVPSPTFVIMRAYKIPNRDLSLHHYDFYRLDDLAEVKDLGIEDDFQDPKTICVVEWADKAIDVLPKERIEIHFKTIDQNKREVKIQCLSS
jgi:tRNA threonylcarbamoyladenosine biosynthesis protein TsaE